MITKTEKITCMSMKLDEAKTIAGELMYEYRARHEAKEAEYQAMKNKEHTYEERNKLLNEEYVLFTLESCCFNIWICRRRSTKMLYDLYATMLEAMELGLEIL